MSKPSSPIGNALLGGSDSDDTSLRRMMASLYDDLRVLARRQLAGERRNHTLQPTALVNEAFLRLTGAAGAACAGEAHFFRLAAKVIRQVLVDYARERAARKRGGGRSRVGFEEALELVALPGVHVLDLDEALVALSEVDPRLAELVEWRFFGGLTVEDVARAREVSVSTIEREWRLARSWLYRHLTQD